MSDMDNKPIMQQFQDDVSAAVDKYRDQGLTFGEAIGALETVKLDLWLEQKTDYIQDIAKDAL